MSRPAMEPLYLCPKCTGIGSGDGTGGYVFQVVLAMAVLVALPYLAAVEIDIIPFLVMTLLWLIPHTVVHEIGHAVGARLSGMRPYAMTIGTGPVVVQSRVRRFVMVWRLIPIGGATMSGSRDGSPVTKSQMIVMIAAGPAVQAIALVGGLAWHPDSAIGEQLRYTLLLTSALLLVGNLVPHRVSGRLGRQMNDGGRILAVVRMPPEQVGLLGANVDWNEAAANQLLGTEEDKLAALARLAEEGADPLVVADQEATTRVLHDDFAGALPSMRRVLADPQVTGVNRANMQNNMAWSLMVAGAGPEAISEATRLSDEALRAAPWSLHVMGTRGCVLVAIGQAADGLPLLRTSLQAPASKVSDAVRQSYLTMGELRIGNVAGASTALAAAEKAAPDHWMTHRARAAMAAAAAPPPTAYRAS